MNFARSISQLENNWEITLRGKVWFYVAPVSNPYFTGASNRRDNLGLQSLVQ
jgi:hypothetical protein